MTNLLILSLFATWTAEYLYVVRPEPGKMVSNIQNMENLNPQVLEDDSPSVQRKIDTAASNCHGNEAIRRNKKF